jgi:hypothetical protein
MSRIEDDELDTLVNESSQNHLGAFRGNGASRNCRRQAVKQSPRRTTLQRPIEVNVEVDQIGKHVEKAVEGYFSKGSSGEPAILQRMVERIVDARLKSAAK